jgi:hypothetical protein
MIRESDADLRAGRKHAALTRGCTIGSAPDYYLMFVRLVEIELTGRRESAGRLPRH